MKNRRIRGLLLSLFFVFVLTLSAGAGEIESNPDFEAGINSINKFGNIILSVGAESMRELGYEPADIITVRIGESELDMPIGTQYSDVDSGDPICCFKTSDDGTELVILAVNNGNLAETMHVAESHEIDADPGFEWVYADGLDPSVTVYISMEEKQGYAEEYAIHQIGTARTNNRSDYPDLSDEDYANFRVIETTGMGTGILYRSSSPIDPSLNRNQEADAALLNAQVAMVMNMADTETSMKEYADYSLTNYSNCDIVALSMEMDMTAESNRSKLAEGFRFIASHDGPYLIHCKEGRDRTGFAAAILECLMGADVDEIVEDYMRTYVNYFGVEVGSAQYETIAEANIEKELARAFGVDDIREEDLDLKACAEQYLQGIGMSDDEIAGLKEKLGKDFEGVNADNSH